MKGVTRFLIAAALLACAPWTIAAPPAAPANNTPAPPPLQERQLGFNQISSAGNLTTRNVLRNLYAEFGLRSDEVVTGARLHLVYTPSPALIPVQSHLKVYLNNELMGVLPINQADLGKEITRDLPLDAQFIADYNSVRFELVGHYAPICEDPLHSSLWVDFSAKSQLILSTQALKTQNDLAMLPEPFFDQRDPAALSVPFVFADRPNSMEQTAGAIMASWLGTLSGWRGASFPTAYGQLPTRGNAIVFATNAQLPDLIEGHAEVAAPTIEILDNPHNPYAKLLLILGRDDNDLLIAAKAVALGAVTLRGQSTTVDSLQTLTPRQPYDAPNWVSLERPTRLGELMEYPNQLEASGMVPRPITLAFNIPPDLFVWRNRGIPLDLKYRYTPPLRDDTALLTVNANNQFIKAFTLSKNANQSIGGVNLPILNENLLGTSTGFQVPSLKLGARNELRFDFSFGAFPANGDTTSCTTTLPLNIQAAIDPDSTIDFSSLYHYKAMPDLRAFVSAGYPFTRLADLSQTQVLMPSQPTPEQTSLLFTLMGRMGAITGYPATQVTIGDDWSAVNKSERDLLILGEIPEQARAEMNKNMSAFVNQTRTSLMLPNRKASRIEPPLQDPGFIAGDTQLETSSTGPISALVGFESPYAKARSVVALMGYGEGSYQQLEQALSRNTGLETITGSVSLFRGNRIDSHIVGEPYYVGSLPWWLLLWYHLSAHPLLLAFIAIVTTLLLAALLWNILRWLARRRLQEHE
jgi:hypothetical protein